MNHPEQPQLDQQYHWECQPQADLMFRQLIDDFCTDCVLAEELRSQMLRQTGTRFFDWVDHVAVGEETELNDQPFESQLSSFGYQLDREDDSGRWYRHDGGLFCPICIQPGEGRRVVIRVEAIDDFLVAHRRLDVKIEGAPCSQLRKACLSNSTGCELWICERTGWTTWDLPSSPIEKRMKSIEHYQAFKLRKRDQEDPQTGFDLARQLIESAIGDLGTDWTCELFFAAERDYWQRRNHAARIQKMRQDRLGLGWANHDHHTYRSSRESFANLISIFELLGFHCRERFYAGEQAGWGAQVLEQSNCGIVIFADVDLTPEELAGDFAHQGLSEKDELGTVGLWCQLHGEAFLDAGMHHLECTFDFDAARKQLAELGVTSMAPFTDFGFLRQAFTTGEVWQVKPERIQQAQDRGYISQQEADKFLREGSIGSHLEILERNEGFKGFNQTGVSEIILKTDPRKVEVGH